MQVGQGHDLQEGVEVVVLLPWVAGVVGLVLLPCVEGVEEVVLLPWVEGVAGVVLLPWMEGVVRVVVLLQWVVEVVGVVLEPHTLKESEVEFHKVLFRIKEEGVVEAVLQTERVVMVHKGEEVVGVGVEHHLMEMVYMER